MKVMKVTLVVLVLAMGVRPQCLENNDLAPPPAQLDLARIDPFSWSLFKNVVPSTGNFIFSPYSIWTVLVLAYFGSEGNTKAQLKNVLHLQGKAEDLATFQALSKQ